MYANFFMTTIKVLIFWRFWVYYLNNVLIKQQEIN
jgi:hypothetical protein